MIETVAEETSTTGHETDPPVDILLEAGTTGLGWSAIWPILSENERKIVQAFNARKTSSDVSTLLQIPEDTVKWHLARAQAKIKEHLKLLKTIQSPSNALIEPIIDRATEVIGDRDDAMRWLGTPVRGLDYATPISLLGTEEGQTRVNDILGQMEHGIW